MVALLFLGCLIVLVAIPVAAADMAKENQRRRLEGMPSPPAHIHMQAEALDVTARRTCDVQGEFHYYDRELKKEIVVVDSHVTKVIS